MAAITLSECLLKMFAGTYIGMVVTVTVIISIYQIHLQNKGQLLSL